MTDPTEKNGEAPPVTYGSYLKVPELLSLQECLSTSLPDTDHDEHLFIVIHQVYELWFKQILFELDKGAELLSMGRLDVFQKVIHRVGTILNVLVHQIDILETMTPVEFNAFRTKLNPASGFQSVQFRELEFLCGFKHVNTMKHMILTEPEKKKLHDRLNAPSLYDHVLQYLHRNGHAIPKEVLERNVVEDYQENEKVLQVMTDLYRNYRDNFEVYRLFENLIQLDQQLQMWRYRHVKMVERMIGAKTGTGGSTGAEYLWRTVERRLFPEIWSVRNHI